MNCGLPSPPEHLVHRKTRIVQPPLVEEFDGAIRPAAPRQCWDAVDHRAIRIRPMLHMEYFTAPLSERQCGDEVIANPRYQRCNLPAIRTGSQISATVG